MGFFINFSQICLQGINSFYLFFKRVQKCGKDFGEMVFAGFGRKLLPGLCVTVAVPVLTQDHIIYRTVQIRNYFSQSFVSAFSSPEIITA